MTLATGPDLLEALQRLAVLDAAQLDELRSGPPTADAHKLAHDLLQRGWLTAFQANYVLQGRGDELLLGPYLLLERLGQGGMGQVYKARHRKLGSVLAVKVIRKDRLDHPDAMRRFIREVRAAAQLNHPNVVLAYDAQEEGGDHFLSMEYVEGTDLGRLVKQRGQLPIAEACDYVRQAALGLQHAHERGLVHRDVKPSNLLLTRVGGVVKVLDLGLARLQGSAAEEDHSSTLTQTGAVLGTPDYIAPEQVQEARDVDGRADVYSLGCTLFFLLTGRPPFKGGSLGEKLACHLTTPPPALEARRADAPPALAAILRKMMAKRREDRFPTAAAVAQALADLRDGVALAPSPSPTPVVAAPATPKDPFADLFTQDTVNEGGATQAQAPRPARVRWLAAGAGGLLLVLSAGVLTLLLWRTGAPPPPPPAPPPDAPLSPLDRLLHEAIPENERFDWQPPELVAVLGNHGLRHWSDGGSGASNAGVACSPDGALVASVGDDGVVRLWDAATGRERSVLPGHGRLRGIAIAPKGDALAYWGASGAVFLCEIDDDGLKNESVLPGHDDGGVSSATFSSDGGALVSVSAAGKTVRVWKRTRGRPEPTAVLQGTGEGVNAIRFLAGDQILAAANNDKTVHLWRRDGDDWKEDRRLTQKDGGSPLLCLDVSPDGSTLAAGGADGFVRLWDLAGGAAEPRAVFPAHPTAVNALAFAPDGAALATAGQDGLARVWTGLNRERPHEAAVLRGHAGGVYGLAFAPTGKLLATCGADRTVRLWEEQEGVWQERFPPQGHTTPVEGVAFTPDGRALASFGANSLFLWRFGEDGPPAPSPRGSPGNTPHAILMLPDGKTLVAASNAVMTLWDLTQEKSTKYTEEIGQTNQALSLAFERHSQTVAVGCANGAVFLWNLSEPPPRKPIPLQAGETQAVALAYSPDGERLAVGGADGDVRFFQLRHKWVDGSRLSGHADGVSSLAFTPDGKTLAVADRSGRLHLWDLQQSPPQPAGVYEDHSGPAALAVAPDGRTLASAGADGRLVWRRTDTWEKQGERTLPLPFHSVAFAPDGRHVATGNANGTVYVFRLAGPPR